MPVWAAFDAFEANAESPAPAALDAEAEPPALDALDAKTGAPALDAFGAQAEPPALDARQTEVMGVVCARCHARPGIGAPLLGDRGAWMELRKQGLETLTAHTVSGFGGMPALGTCSYCSEDDLRTMVAWMAGLVLPGDASEAAGAHEKTGQHEHTEKQEHEEKDERP